MNESGYSSTPLSGNSVDITNSVSWQPVLMTALHGLWVWRRRLLTRLDWIRGPESRRLYSYEKHELPKQPAGVELTLV